MKFRVLLVLFLMFGNPTYADERTDKIRDLMEALGLLEMWSQQMEMGKEQSETMGQQLIDQMMSQLNPNEEFQERFTVAFNNFMSKVETPWSAQEIVDVWASYYGPAFTNEELDQLIAFYTSPLGKKDVRVTKDAMVSFTNHFQAAAQPIMEAATNEYVQDLQIIAKECNCAK